MNRLESIKKKIDSESSHDNHYLVHNNDTRYLLQRLERYESALQGIVQTQGNIRPYGESWEYIGEFKECVKLAKEALKE